MGQKIEIDLTWHDSQWDAFHHIARFLVFFCGRRWGKTRGAIQWLVEQTLSGPNRLGWWVAPTYKQAKIAYRYFRRIFWKSGIIVKDNKSELTISLIMGCRLEFRSAEIPDNLRGEGVDAVVLDECASMPEIVWTEVLRPTLMDSKGRAVFIGTPKGMNWVYALWQKGQGEDPDWKSFQFSTFDNPYIDKEEIEKAVLEMPEIVAKQEIYAEPMESEGVVFRNVDEIATLKMREAKPGERCTLGVDLAKYRDFTVLVVRVGQEVIWMDRFNQIDWSLQKRKIADACQRFNRADIIIDSTGVGDPTFEDLKRAGLPVTPYQLTTTSKKELIDNLILAFDKKDIRILDHPIMKAECKGYAYELTSSGNLRTNAPTGQHDDVVIALALAFSNTIAKGHSGLLDFYAQELARMKGTGNPAEAVAFGRRK